MAIPPPWRHLPSELLHLISQKAGGIATYIRMRSACSSWRSALPPSLLPPQFPWLLLPYDPDEGSLSLFSLQTRQTLRLDLPEKLGKAICGSSHGWLALVDLYANLSLFHPITRSEIPLPPPAGFPRFDDVAMAGRAHGWTCPHGFPSVREGHPWKVFLSSSPTDTARECVVAVVLADSEEFAFCYLGEAQWSTLDSELGSPVMSILYREGKFYVADQHGAITILDAHPWAKKAAKVLCPYNGFSLTGLYLLTLPGLEEDDELRRLDGVVMLLVESFSIGEDEIYDWVKMLQLRRGELQWEEVSTVGGSSMFVAGFHSSAVHGHDWSVFGCERDCIYFNESEEIAFDPGRNLYFLDVFHLKDGRFEQYSCPCEKYERAMPPPTWLTPTLC